ncbi:MAG: hypothetical protein ACI9YE_003538, partial [Psychroserpens sp.]
RTVNLVSLNHRTSLRVRAKLQVLLHNNSSKKDSVNAASS